MFISSTPVDNCLLLEFHKQKDIALTFFRLQEFYESDKESLNNKYFGYEEFIDELIDDNGNIPYFNYWNGFNIKDHIFQEWWSITQYDTKREKQLYLSLLHNIDITRKFYVVACMKNDQDTKNHELCHALYYLDDGYYSTVGTLTSEFYKKHTFEYDTIIDRFTELGYNKKVHVDELNAYISTSSKDEFEKEFKLNYDKLLPFIQQYKDLFQKYLTI